MAWRVVSIITKNEFCQIFESDGEPAPIKSGVLSETYSKKESRQFYKDDGGPAPRGKETKPEIFARIFHLLYFMGKIFWPLVVAIAGAIIASVIT